MRENLLVFITAFMVAFSGAMMPGPMFTMVINHASRKGLSGGILVVVGHALLEIFLVIALLLGLQAWMSKPIISGLIGLSGGVVLIVLGLLMLKDAWQGQLQLKLEINKIASNSQRVDTFRPGAIGGGILTSLFNPYFILWWGTIGAGYLIMASKQGIVGVAFFFSGHILADFAWFGLVSIAISKGSRFLKPQHYQALIGGCGLFMAGVGLYFLHIGWTFLFI